MLRANGAKQRPSNKNEKAALRYGMTENVEYDKLVRVAYRDGGNRKLLLFSTVRGYCQRYEDLRQKIGSTTPTTIYVVPPSGKPGSKNWLSKGSLPMPTPISAAPAVAAVATLTRKNTA